MQDKNKDNPVINKISMAKMTGSKIIYTENPIPNAVIKIKITINSKMCWMIKVPTALKVSISLGNATFLTISGLSTMEIRPAVVAMTKKFQVIVPINMYKK